MKKKRVVTSQMGTVSSASSRAYCRIVRVGVLSLAITGLWLPAQASQEALTAPLATIAAATSISNKPVGPTLHCSGGVEQRTELNIPLGHSIPFDMGEGIRARAVGNPSVVQSIQVGPKQLYLVGTRVGSTNMMVQGTRGVCTAVTVTVSADPTGLQQAITMLMPEEKDVRIGAIADAIVLSGQVADAVQAQRIMELAQRFVATNHLPALDTDTPNSDPKANSSGSGSPDAAKARVINMLTVTAPQQVMLEVKVAEVSKKLIDELGLTGELVSSHVAASIGKLLVLGAKKNKATLTANKSEEPVKILAEPNLMAISGQKANFMAGGKVFIPVPQSFGVGQGLVTLQEETYGVKLTFLPTVLKNDVINLQVSPEVSDLSSTGVQFKYGEDRIQPLTTINVRSASTTVQLKDGQSFAIGGLIKDSMRAQVNAFPGLGEIPVLGALFRSTNYQREKTELVFIVTPHLVKPLPTSLPLPTDTIGDVSGWKVLATGNMESNASRTGNLSAGSSSSQGTHTAAHAHPNQRPLADMATSTNDGSGNGNALPAKHADPSLQPGR